MTQSHDKAFEYEPIAPNLISESDERLVAGALLLKPHRASELLNEVEPEDFVLVVPRAIAWASRRLLRQERPPNLLATHHVIRESALFPKLTLDELSATTDFVGDSVRFASIAVDLAALKAARRVADLARQRELVAACSFVRARAGAHTDVCTLFLGFFEA